MFSFSLGFNTLQDSLFRSWNLKIGYADAGVADWSITSGPPDNPAQTAWMPGVDNFNPDDSDCVSFDGYPGIYFTSKFVPDRLNG